MRIIEQYIKGKKDGNCEDGLLITEDFVSVIDGVTSKSNYRLDDMTTGQIAVKIIKESIKNFNSNITYKQAIDKLTQSIRQFYIEEDMLEIAKKNTTNRLAACAIIFSKKKEEIWIIGDCQYMVDGEHYENPKVVDEIISEARSLFVASELKMGKTLDEMMEFDSSREYILPLIKRGATYQNDQSNNQYSYAVIDGFDVTEKDVQVVSTRNAEEIVLASDGYPKLFPTLSETEKYLQYILKVDPLCYKKYKSTKGLVKGNDSFDDRTYVRLQVVNT